MTKNNKVMMVTTGEIAKAINVSESTIDCLDRDKYLPEAVKIGKRIKRWRVMDIIDWVAWGCPSRTEFNKLRMHASQRCVACNFGINLSDRKEIDGKV